MHTSLYQNPNQILNPTFTLIEKCIYTTDRRQDALVRHFFLAYLYFIFSIRDIASPA